MKRAARAGVLGEFRESIGDFVESFAKLPIAWHLATHDIIARYRGSVLGPWWITITMGALILGIGINYAALFHLKVADLLPYVAVGLVFWSYISMTLNEGGEAFISAGPMLRQSALPLPLFVARCIIRNLINLIHHIVILVAVMLWFRIFPGWGFLWAILGVVLTTLNLGWMILLLALSSARFRDVPQIVSALLQFVFFLSPVFWKPTQALEKSPLVSANPFYFAIQSVREPLLAGALPVEDLNTLAPLALAGWVVTFFVYAKIRRRIVHYL